MTRIGDSTPEELVEAFCRLLIKLGPRMLLGALVMLPPADLDTVRDAAEDVVDGFKVNGLSVPQPIQHLASAAAGLAAGRSEKHSPDAIAAAIGAVDAELRETHASEARRAVGSINTVADILKLIAGSDDSDPTAPPAE